MLPLLFTENLKFSASEIKPKDRGLKITLQEGGNLPPKQTANVLNAGVGVEQSVSLKGD